MFKRNRSKDGRPVIYNQRGVLLQTNQTHTFELT